MINFNPSEITFADKKIRVLIAGFPGIGKTTLALSAPKPLYIDVDLSAERINRKVLNMAAGFTQPKDYDELRKDLGIGASDMELQAVRQALSPIETIVIDTGGKLLSLMGEYGKRIDPKYGQRDGSLSLKGYGWLGKEFQRFLNHCITALDKHIVIIFHAVEEKDGDETKLRIKAEGSSKNNVWEVMDLGGFIEMHGRDRTIGFSNCERYFAKGTRGINGIYKIPDLNTGVKNDFLAQLFAQYNEISEEEAVRAQEEKDAYEEAMAEGKRLLTTAVDADSFNAMSEQFGQIQHYLTSKVELTALWKAKVKELNLSYDRSAKIHKPKEAK